ncbi:MAG TPA: hypothetical protein VFS13_00525 [Steroidobacteraceae bacterium]|nr:hypothetical protein [Steroidobacteraceae bacterium]
MSELDAIVTGRDLVSRLGQLGVGRWGADAVRQWIREEPPCPVAEHAEQGKPHRYRTREVLTWLRDRAQRERAKGFTRGGADGVDLVDRIDAALAGTALLDRSAAAALSDMRGNFAPSVAPAQGAGGTSTDRAKAPREQIDWLQLSDSEALLQVLQGRDPRNWKAAEEAMTTRRERLEAERLLIPVAELEAALDVHTEHTRKGIAGATQSMKLALRDYIDPARLHDAERAIELQHEQLLQQLASTADLEPPRDAPRPDEAGP